MAHLLLRGIMKILKERYDDSRVKGVLDFDTLIHAYCLAKTVREERISLTETKLIGRIGERFHYKNYFLEDYDQNTFGWIVECKQQKRNSDKELIKIIQPMIDKMNQILVEEIGTEETRIREAGKEWGGNKAGTNIVEPDM